MKEEECKSSTMISPQVEPSCDIGSMLTLGVKVFIQEPFLFKLGCNQLVRGYGISEIT